MNITRCLLRRPGQPLSRDDGFAGITLDNVSDCTLSNTALFLGTGKGIVCRRGQPSIVISNCLIFASEAVWMHPAPEKPATLRLQRSSVKGGTVILFPHDAPHELTVEARSNLFNTAFIIVDQRPQADDLLRRAWLSWQDQGNLFALARPPGSRAPFIRFRTPGRGPPSLKAWNDFWEQTGGGSFEAATARFATHRQPGSPSALELPDFGDFSLTDLEPLPGGFRLTRPEWSRYGADTNSIGPTVASARRR